MKILEGWGTGQGGTFMYSYMSHTYLLQSQVILNFGLHVLHFLNCHNKQKDSNTEIIEKF